MKTKQFMHSYEGYSGVASTCRITLYQSATGMTVAIVDEMPTNSGTPVREFAEQLATQAYRMTYGANDAHVRDFIYIEHSPQPPGAYVYHRIEFDWDYQSFRFVHPERIEMTVDEVREFVGDESLT